jgi:cephalosporin-C deacetylase-like acetyl esterase
VRCHATYTFNAALSVSTVAVVGVALEQLRPSMATPADFDAYWQAQRAQLAAVPMTVTARPVPQANPQLVCQDVSVACQPGKAVRGYLSRPANAAPRSLPAVLWLPFAGVSGANQYQSLRGAEWGALSLSINIFGIENDLSTQAYAQMEQGPFKHYPHQGREHRDTYFFHDAFLMSWRALDYLTAQPEWNGKILAVFGSSQGGALAFVAGGFDPRVTLIAAAVPAMCDHTAPAVGRMVAWPQLIPHTPDGAPDARVTTTARYYDVVNFASRCTAPALVSVGFLDIASPPTSVYAAYNAIPGAKKQIMNEWTRGHECSEEFDQLFRRTLFPEAK